MEMLCSVTDGTKHKGVHAAVPDTTFTELNSEIWGRGGGGRGGGGGGGELECLGGIFPLPEPWWQTRGK